MGETDCHLSRSGVLSDVGQCLLDDTDDLHLLHGRKRKGRRVGVPGHGNGAAKMELVLRYVFLQRRLEAPTGSDLRPEGQYVLPHLSVHLAGGLAELAQLL